MPSGKSYLLLISAGGSFVAPFMVSGLIVATPTIGADLSMDSVALGWLPTAFFLAAAMFLVPFGRMADIVGVKKIFTMGVIIYLVSALAAALSPSSSALIAARFLTGMGAAMVFGTSFALLGLSLPETERGRAIGINISANLTGFALGFFAGGYLTHYLTWRAVFAATLPIDIMVLVLLFSRLPGECALAECKHSDLIGMVLNAVIIFLTVTGLSRLMELQGALLLLGAGAALLLFVLWETRIDCPVIDVRLFARNRTYALYNLAALIYFASSFAVIFLFSLYMQYIRGFDDRLVGMILALSTFIMAFLVGYSGNLADRTRPGRIASWGALVTAASLILFASISTTTPISRVAGGLILLLSGGAFFQPPIVKCVLGSISREMYGVGSGLVEMMRLMGQTVSMAVVIIFFTLYVGEREILPENYPAFMDSLRAMFTVFLALCLISLALVVLVERLEKRCG